MSQHEALDAILDGYEDAWREAALKGARRFDPHCAITVRPLDLHNALWHIGDWLTCVECGSQCVHPAALMIHLFDVHGWTWDMFANKFRDALSRGAVSEPQARPA